MTEMVGGGRKRVSENNEGNNKLRDIGKLDAKTTYLKDRIDTLENTVVTGFQRVEDKLDTRLETCQKRFTKLEISNAVSTSKVSTFIAGAAIIVSSIIGGTVAWLFGKFR